MSDNTQHERALQYGKKAIVILIKLMLKNFWSNNPILKNLNTLFMNTCWQKFGSWIFPIILHHGVY